MSPTTPSELEGLGAATLVPTLGRGQSTSALAALGLGAEEGFVLSRVDGHTTLGGICTLVPFDAAVTAKILRRLHDLGAIVVPGLPPPKPKTQPAPPPAAKPETPPTPPPPVVVPPGVDLTAEQVRRIDAFYTSLRERDAFELLEIDRAADDRDVKRAYFRLSKEFHPDRFFGRSLGEYRERLSQVFQAIKTAFELLSDAQRRAIYEASAPKQS